MPSARSLLRSIVEGVLRDEARHVAFGNVYVGVTLAAMHPDDREDVAQFAFEALMAMVEASGRRKHRPPQPDPTFVRVLENSGIDPLDFARGLTEARERGLRFQQPPGTVHAFKDLMMPALVRVGAVTDRTRGLLQAEGLEIYADTRVLEELEDAETGVVEIAEAD